MSVQNKTMAMKARVANFIRKSIYKKNIQAFTEKEKLELFEVIFNMSKEMHNELLAYKSKRKDKAILYKERVARGYKFKKKTSKREYEETLK